MSLNAGALKVMASKGLSMADVIEIAEAMEKKADRTNAERQARHREKARNAVTVTVEQDETKEKSPKPSKENTPLLTPKGVSPRRLPDDFVMPDDWKDWARDKRGWSTADIETEAENFTDYWQARGSGATKRDWRKAWQTWVRNSKRADGNHRNDKPLSESDVRAGQERTAALYERMGRADEAAEIRRRWATGPPGQPIGNIVKGIADRAGRAGHSG